MKFPKYLLDNEDGMIYELDFSCSKKVKGYIWAIYKKLGSHKDFNIDLDMLVDIE